MSLSKYPTHFTAGTTNNIDDKNMCPNSPFPLKSSSLRKVPSTSDECRYISQSAPIMAQ